MGGRKYVINQGPFSAGSKVTNHSGTRAFVSFMQRSRDWARLSFQVGGPVMKLLVGIVIGFGTE